MIFRPVRSLTWFLLAAAGWSCTAAKPELTALTTPSSAVAPFDGATITNVTVQESDGTYTTSAVLNVDVTFSEVVSFTGAPRLLLETGPTDLYAMASANATGITITFTHTIGAGESTSDLDYQSSSALDLNGGTVVAASGRAVSLILPLPGAAGSISANKHIVVDTLDPVMVGTLTDGVSYGSSTMSPLLNWTAAMETGSGISNYQVGIGTTAGGVETLGWTDIGDVTTYQASGMALANGFTYYPSVRAIDNVGRVSNVITGDGWVADTLPPTVGSVTSSTTDGSYGVAQVITLLVNFSEAVTVTGSPRLLLETGATDRYAVYSSGSGSSTLTFTYTVQAGDTAADLNYQSMSALELNGGSIGDAFYAATLTLPSSGSPTLAGSANLQIDTTAPMISGSVTDSVTNWNSTATSPSLSWPPASDSGGSGIDYYEMALGTTAGDNNTMNWVSVGGSTTYQLTSLSLAAGTIYYPTVRAVDNAGNRSTAINGDGWLVDVSGPQVLNVTASTTNGAYRTSEVITVQIVFDEAVTVSGGSPQLSLETGATDRQAIYSSGSGTSTLEFIYTVTAGDTSSDLDYVSTSAVSLNGATLSDGANNTAILTLPTVGGPSSLAGNKDLVIDTTAPSFSTTVNDGLYHNMTTESPSISWTAATDTGGSGISHYQIAIGTTAGGTQVLTWTDIGNSTSVTRTGLTLTEGTTYYPTIRAVDVAGNISSGGQTGNGWIPDASGPPAPTVDDDAFSYWLTETPFISWSEVSDGGSGIARYEVAIGSSSGATDIQNWTHVSLALGMTFTGLNLTAGNTYHASVRAVDNAGNTGAEGHGDGWLLKPQGWQQQAYVKASNNTAMDSFGTAVSVSGDTMAVGVPAEDSNQTTITNGTFATGDNSNSDSGAVYVYKRNSSGAWEQQAYLKVNYQNAGDNFGSTVALDGNLLVVGAPGEASNQTTITAGASSNNSAPSSGAAYIFRRSGSSWSLEAMLKAPNAETWDYFGASTAVSGETVAVGAIGESSNQTSITNGTTASNDNSFSNTGAVYIFTKSNSVWFSEAYIKAPNSDSNDNFGLTLDLDIDTLVVGVPNEDSDQATITNGSTASGNNARANAGAAYVFTRTGVSWQQQAYLKAPVPDASDVFGGSVAIHGDTIIVGATGEDSNQSTIINGSTASADNSAANSGAAYIFKRSGATWAQEAFIKAPNSGADDNFGKAVDIHGDMIAVSAYGEDSSQTTITQGTTASSDNSASDSGAVYVFQRTNGAWSQRTYLKANNSESMDLYGRTLSLSEGTLAIAAPYEASAQSSITNGPTVSENNSSPTSGAVYVYTETVFDNWSQQAYAKAPAADTLDAYGSAVAIHRDTAIVAATAEDSNQTTITNGATASSDNSIINVGAAYILRRTGTTWNQEAFLKAPNANASDFFGSSVTIFGDRAAVGATGEDSNQTTITNGSTASSDNSVSGAGAVYIFKRTGTTWAQEAYIKAPNTAANQVFGSALAFFGNTLAVSAPQESSNQTTITNGTTASSDASRLFSGAVYIFTVDGTTWTQQAYIKAPNADSGDRFGSSIDLDRDTLIVGAIQESSNQTAITNGAVGSANNTMTASGAAYVFVRDNIGDWSMQAYLKPSASSTSDRFGSSVSVSGDKIAVGAPEEDSQQRVINNGTLSSTDESSSNSGAVFVFQRTGTMWNQQAYIKAPNSNPAFKFGTSLKMDGNILAVGSPYESSSASSVATSSTAAQDVGSANSGAAYVFRCIDGSYWMQEAYLKASNSEANDNFGKTLGISGRQIIVGAPYESSNQTTITNGTTASGDNSANASGAAYIFGK